MKVNFKTNLNMKKKTKQLLAVIAIGLIVVACTFSSSENKAGQNNTSSNDTIVADTSKNQTQADTTQNQ
jgi:hypothetical protein